MTVRNIPPLQSVTAVGATSTILTTFTGGLSSRNSSGANSLAIGDNNTSTGATTVVLGSNIADGGRADCSLLGRSITLSGFAALSSVFGASNTVNVLTSGNYANTSIFGNNNSYKFNFASAGSGDSAIFGQHNTVRGYGACILGNENVLAEFSVAEATDTININILGQGNIVGNGSYSGILIGNTNIAAASTNSYISIGNTNTTNHSNTYLIGSSLTTTQDYDFQLGTSSHLYKFAGLFPDNNSVDFGTSRSASIYHDGTNFIVNPQLAGAGYLAVGPTGNFDLKVNKIGIAGQAPGGAVINGGTITSSTTTSLFNATLVYTGTSGSLRAMQFILTASNTGGTAPSPASFCVTNMNCDLAGNGQATGFLGQASIGAATTLATMTSCTLIGLNAQISGNGNSHTANLIIKSVRAADPGAYTTSGTLNSWALLCEGDGGIVTDKKWYWENSTTAKGDSYYTFNSASTDLNHYIDNTKVMTEDNDLIETFVPFKVAGVTLGASVHTITTPATNDDPIEVVQQNRVATTDATVATLDTYTIPASTTVFIVTTVVARRTGGAAGTAEDGAGYEFATTIKNVAGTATIIAGPTATYTHESQAAFAATHDVNAATVRVRVTGVVNNNITWHSTSRIYQVGS